MTPRERVLAAAEHKPVDRPPVFLWLNSHAAMKMMARMRWSRNLGMTAFAKVANRIHTTRRVIPDDLRDGLPILFQIHADQGYNLELGSDVAVVHPYHWSLLPNRVWLDEGRLHVRDFFGTVRGIRGIYLENVRPAVETAHDLLTLRMPDMSNDAIWEPMKKYRAAHPDVAIVSETWGVQDLTATWLWRMDEFMIAYYEHPEKLEVLFDKIEKLSLTMVRKGVQAGADIVMIYDDYGTQQGPQISMKMWKEFTFPHLERIIAAIHGHGAKAMLHSCGHQMPFLPYYVEAGLDILQSFQLGAGNDLARAKAEYGKDLCFATGIDVQSLEQRTPNDVKTSILDSCRVGFEGGGFILATTHMLQPTMPLENMEAVMATVKGIQEGAMH